MYHNALLKNGPSLLLSLFQTPSGSWHIPSILMAASWLVSGIFIFANLRANRDDRLKAYEKERQSIVADKEAKAKIAELEEKMKPIPLHKRLITCLDEIDKGIVASLRAGTTRFHGNLASYQLAELQKLAAEDQGAKYIVLTLQSALVFTKLGTATPVQFELKPALLE